VELREYVFAIGFPLYVMEFVQLFCFPLNNWVSCMKIRSQHLLF